MNVDKWTTAEKKIARRAFDAALTGEFAELMDELRKRSAKLASPADTWDMHHYLSNRLHEIERRYDFRYSQLVIVFGRLMREARINERDIEGLAAKKLTRSGTLLRFDRPIGRGRRRDGNCHNTWHKDLKH